MKRLSLSNRVLYVEYQASFLHFSLFSRYKGLRESLRKVGENLYVFTPRLSLPFGYYFRSLNKINQRIMAHSLKKIIKDLGFGRSILWIYPPCAVDLIGRLDEKLVLYHCAADFPNEKKNRLRKKTILSMEEELIKKSDIVLTLTEALYKKHRHINGSTFLFPSAVDENLFSPHLYADVDEPEDIAGLKRPRIGMVGYLDGRVLDVDLLCDIADQHPEWSVILIGPKFRYVSRLNRLSRKNNIYFLNEKDNNEVPVYIKSLDVCIIPYLVNKFTNNVSPLKLFEYMALGKPIVATGLADLRIFEDTVSVSRKEDFVKNISLSLLEKDERLVDKRLELAKKNSWDERLRVVAQLIEERL
ncbi:MAG: glycosyltransferase [Candidatus Omnitrophica bacterium]|nr:glycosyltransferase [Candidatus Omnitrophota bacterium]